MHECARRDVNISDRNAKRHLVECCVSDTCQHIPQYFHSSLLCVHGHMSLRQRVISTVVTFDKRNYAQSCKRVRQGGENPVACSSPGRELKQTTTQ